MLSSLENDKRVDQELMKSAPIRGYAEGYYGRLLSWTDRLQLLDTLQRHGLNTYYYAPKEDASHRLNWRDPYAVQWRECFRIFCNQARERDVSVIAGVAPGIDFDFKHLKSGKDFRSLVNKCQQLLDDGAVGISLLMDDIDADFHTRCGAFESEGLAHASLANELSKSLVYQTGEMPNDRQQRARAIWVTPRIYADELAIAESDYLPDFLTQLEEQHLVLYCGSDIVSRYLTHCHDRLVSHYSNHRIVVWDNLYANDYCPRRLFLGPWEGREGVSDILLNPTGHVHTDCLLLDMMASHDSSENPGKIRDQTFARHGVPDAFLSLTPYFHHPVFNDSEPESFKTPSDEVFEALEICLWQWKSPLSREWYPYLFGLKHDLLIYTGQLPTDRIMKTQNRALAARLLRDE